MSQTHHSSEHFDHNQEIHPGDHHHEPGPKARKQIWLVFWIMFGITVLEFVAAFAMPRSGARNILFIVMTLVKAFYIVGYFMHLKHEVRNLILTIMVPLIFIVWLIVALLVESAYMHTIWS
jgi:cytochrome c oxidase subunit IV